MSIADSSRDSTASFRPEQWFTAVLVVYGCLGAHFLMRNAGGIGLDMPANIVTWLFASVFIGAGFWQISTSHTLVYSRFVRLGLLGCLGLLIPWFYPKSLALHYEGPRMLALIMGLMFYVALLQFNFSRQRLMAGLYWLLVFCGSLWRAIDYRPAISNRTVGRIFGIAIPSALRRAALTSSPG